MKTENKKRDMITKILLSFILVLTVSLTLPTASHSNTLGVTYENGLPVVWGVELPYVVVVERGDSWEKTVWSDGLVEQTFGKPEFVQTSNGYKAYDITTTPTKINVNSKVTPLSFDKTNCTNEIFERDSLDTFIGQEYWSLVTNSGSGWELYDALSLACDYTTSKDSDSQNLTVHRSHPKGEFYSTYSLLDDGSLTKPLLSFVNNPASNGTSVAGLQNIKVSFANVWNNVHVSGLNINGTQISGGTLASMFPVNEPVIITKSDIAGLLQGKSVSFSTDGSNEFIFDSTLGFDDLVAMQITRNPDNTANIVWVYGKSINITLGETITLDPTFGFQSDSVYGVTTSSSADTNCNSGSSLNSISVIAMEDSATSGNCDFFSSQFDVTGIPDGSNLRSAQLKLTVDTASDINCDINAMIAKPSIETASDLKLDVNNGTSYIDNNDWCTTIGQKIITLPDSFETDCESKLTSDWCAVGFTFDSITRDSTDHLLELSDIQLIIQYGTNITPNIPTLNSVAQIADTGSLLLTYTNATNMDNATQPAIANYTIFTGETLFLNTPLKDWNATQEVSNTTSIGAITTSSNFEGLFNFDNGIFTGTLPLLYIDFSNANGLTNLGTGGSALDGTNNGATSGGTGILDQSYSFDGINDYVTLGTTSTFASMHQANAKSTISFWLKADAGLVPDARILSTVSDSNAIGWNIKVGSGTNDKICFGYSAGGGQYEEKCSSADYLLDDSQWHFYVITQDLTLSSLLDHKFYRDGALYDTEQEPSITLSASSTTAFVLNIARRGDAVGYGDFEMDNLFIRLSTVLTPSEIEQLYNNGLSLDPISTQRYYDYSSDNNHALISGNVIPNSSHISSNYSNEAQISNAGLNITSASYPSGTNAFTVNAIITPNQTSQFTMLSATSSVGNILFNIDDSFVAMSINAVDIFNKTLSTSMNSGSATALSITRSVAGVYELYINGTAQSLGITDTTSLGTITNNLWFVGTKPDLTNSGIWRLDEFSIRSDAQTAQDSIDFGKRIVPFSTLATGQTVISPASGTYTDTSVGYDDSQCYKVSAWNSVGESSNSNIKCNTSDSEAGGGGGGSSGGGSGTLFPTSVSNALLLNLGSKTISHSLGEKRTYSLELLWDKTKEFSLTINSIKIGNGNFDSLSIIPELLPTAGKKIIDGKGEIFLTVDAPGDKCNEIQMTARCVYVKTYTIPVTVSVTDLLGINYPDIPAILTISIVDKFPIGLAVVVILLLAVSYPIAKIISQNSKKSSRKSPKQMQKDHQKALKKSEKSERKQAKHDMNLFKKIKKEF